MDSEAENNNVTTDQDTAIVERKENGTESKLEKLAPIKIESTDNVIKLEEHRFGKEKDRQRSPIIIV